MGSHSLTDDYIKGKIQEIQDVGKWLNTRQRCPQLHFRRVAGARSKEK
jgi:hypothetical protein